MIENRSTGLTAATCNHRFACCLVAGLILAAWASAGPIWADEIQVGFATVDITPPKGYPMAGYFYARLSTGVHDPLHAKAIVLLQGDCRAALVVCDLIGVTLDLSTMVRRRAEKATGIPAAHIMITGTHTHTAPDYARQLRQVVRQQAGARRGDVKHPYAVVLVRAIVQSIVRANAALRPVRLQVGMGREERVAFNRRFVLKDGTIKTWGNYKNPMVLRAAGPMDPELAILLFRDRTDALPRGLLSVFALHLDTTGGTAFSADFPYYMERLLREKLGHDLTSVFAIGTCGDINHVNPRSAKRNGPELIGTRLGKAALAALPELRTVSPRLEVARSVIQVPLQEYTAEDLAKARAVIGRDAAGKKVAFFDEVKAHKLQALQELETAHADSAQRPGQQPAAGAPNGSGKQLPVEVQVIRVGKETAIVGLPGEVFVQLGLDIKRMSPFVNTFVIELANSNAPRYIPTQLAYRGGGYEVVNSVFKPGGGEQIVAAALDLLRDLKVAGQPEKAP